MFFINFKSSYCHVDVFKRRSYFCSWNIFHNCPLLIDELMFVSYKLQCEQVQRWNDLQMSKWCETLYELSFRFILPTISLFPRRIQTHLWTLLILTAMDLFFMHIYCTSKPKLCPGQSLGFCLFYCVCLFVCKTIQ